MCYFEYVTVYILELACVRNTLVFDTYYDAYLYMTVVRFNSDVIVVVVTKCNACFKK